MFGKFKQIFGISERSYRQVPIQDEENYAESGLDCAVFSMQGRRRRMEDAHFISTNFLEWNQVYSPYSLSSYHSFYTISRVPPLVKYRKLCS